MKNKVIYYVARIVITIGMMIGIIALITSCINKTGGWNGDKNDSYVQDGVESVEGGEIPETED